MERRSLLTLLVATTLLAAIAYAAVAATVGRPIVFRDAFAYNASAQRLLNTGSYSYEPNLMSNIETATPNAFTMPGYSVFLAAIYAFVPRTADIVANILAAQLPIIVVQLLLAVLTAAIIAFAGYRLGGNAVGWTAGALACGYLPFGMNATVALTETLALFLTAVVMLASVELFRRPALEDPRSEYGWMIALGVSAGLLILVRPTIALWMILPFALWLFLHRTDLKRASLVAGTGLACLALLLAPWVVRNAIVLDKFIPLTATVSTPLLDSVGGAVFTPAEEALMNKVERAGGDPIRAVAVQRLKNRWNASPSEFIEWKATYLWNAFINHTNLPVDILTDIQVSGYPEPGNIADAGGFFPITSDAFYLAMFEFTTWYHRLLLILAFVGVALGRRRKVMWLLASVPIYFAAVHTAILLMVRYLYPTTPAIILLAAFGAVGTMRLAQSVWSNRAEPVV